MSHYYFIFLMNKMTFYVKLIIIMLFSGQEKYKGKDKSQTAPPNEKLSPILLVQWMLGGERFETNKSLMSFHVLDFELSWDNKDANVKKLGQLSA